MHRSYCTCFNPRAPHGARQERLLVYQLVIVVSIHAPRTGRDRLADARAGGTWRFQSTRPARGATMLAAGSVTSR